MKELPHLENFVYYKLGIDWEAYAFALLQTFKEMQKEEYERLHPKKTVVDEKREKT